MDKQRIRKRASYRMFKELLDFLNTEPSKADILKEIWKLLDGRFAFGSEKNSDAACESLELLLSDAKEGQKREA